MDYMLALAVAAMDRLWPAAPHRDASSVDASEAASSGTDSAGPLPKLRSRAEVAMDHLLVSAGNEREASGDWRWRARSVQAEMLADVFYMQPALAEDMARVVGVPDFITRLAKDVNHLLAERQGWAAWAARKAGGKLHDRTTILEALEQIRSFETILAEPTACGLTEERQRQLELALIREPSAVLWATRQAEYAVPFSMVLNHELADVKTSRGERGGRDIDAQIALKAACLHSVDSRLQRMVAGARPLSGLPCKPSGWQAAPPAVTVEWAESALDQRERQELEELAAGLRSDLERLVGERDEHLRSSLSAASHPPAPTDVPPRFAPRAASEANLIGLALSGGGIRSATFSLGALQALAQLDLLRSVDYLSTVSGGGYIGSWLLGWTCRCGGIRQVQRLLSPGLQPDPAAEVMRPLRHLRDYGNYLAPQPGFFTADSWTLGAIWVRNTLLNLAILTLFFATALLAPRLIVLSPLLFNRPPGPIGHWYVLAGAISVLLFVCFQTGRYMSSFDRPAEPPGTPCADGRGEGGDAPDLLNVAEQHVQLHVVIPTFCSALLLSGELYMLIANRGASFLDVSAHVWRGWLVGGAGALTLFAGLLLLQLRGHYAACFNGRLRAMAAITLTAIGAAIGGGLLLVALCNLFASWSGTGVDAPAGMWHAIALGPPLLVTVFALTIVLHLGLLGRAFTDERREWWSRLGAWLLIYSVAWTAMFAIAIYAPYLLALARGWITAGTLTWMATTAAGVYAARRPSTGARRESGRAAPPAWQDRVAAVAPFVFVIGLLVLIALGVHLLLIRFQFGADEWAQVTFARLRDRHWEYLDHRDRGGMPFVIAAVAAVGCALLAWRVDINDFSMHHMYKNRLLRCYLAASRAARPRASRFTGFDIQDDVKLHAFRSRASNNGEYTGPFPIVNATVNFVKSGDLAWLERRGESFAFTPLYCGFTYARSRDGAAADASSGLSDETWRPTDVYGYPGEGGIGLGTAAAISGAAANPNMGYHTSPAASFLMTVFNARLGWWMGNPRDEQSYRQSSPTFGLRYLLAELFGTSTDKTPFINLSDGGHYDNLGLYELVRRRCRTIIVIDGEQDGGLTSRGLGMAVRKCRIDFGAQIDIGLTPIQEVINGASRAHVVVGDITYGDGTRGMLVYVKSSLTGDESADVREYSLRRTAFPHQSTADQFFDESQFESYRALGYHITLGAFKYPAALPGCEESGCQMPVCLERGCRRLDSVFRYMRALWFPPLPTAATTGTNGGLTYDGLITRIAEDHTLDVLDPELTRGVRIPWHRAPERTQFYTYAAMISFMHQIFNDARLEILDEHPHNEGWMSIFRQWARSPRLQATWRLVGPNYDERFRRFCETRLELPLTEGET